MALVPHQIPFADLQMDELIGSGGFGSVYRAAWHRTPGSVELVAVKLMHCARPASAAAAFEREVALLASLSHDHIVSLLGVSFAPGGGHACLVAELVAGGSLHDFLHRPDSGRSCSVAETLRVGLGVASAMAYLHEQSVIHRDLKPANVLLDTCTMHARICDFGISRVQAHTMQTTVHHAGTPAYMAPELFGHGRVSERCDSYSFAVTLWECLTGELPWSASESPLQIIFAVGVEQRRPLMPPACPASLAGLIVELWDQRPDQRPSFEQAESRLMELSSAQHRGRQPF
jgi:serine/threonine protein kinase